MSCHHHPESFGEALAYLALCATLIFVPASCEMAKQEELEREHREKYCDVMILKETEEVYTMHQMEEWGIEDFDPDTKCGFRVYEEDGTITLKNEETGECLYQAEVHIVDGETKIKPILLEKTEKCPECYGDIEAE